MGKKLFGQEAFWASFLGKLFGQAMAKAFGKAARWCGVWKCGGAWLVGN